VSQRTSCAPQPKRLLSEVTKDVDGSKGRYVLRHEDGAESDLTYSRLSPQTVIADHTAVAEGHNGQGIGLKLLEALIANARAEGFKIIPLCPFENAQRAKHPEWADLFNV